MATRYHWGQNMYRSLVLTVLVVAAEGATAGQNQAPTATLTSPVTGASFIAPATVSLAATASDKDGTVARVDFFAGTTLIGSSSTAPYQATWSNVAAGTYSITAKAVDNAGATGTSSAVSITVASATSLVITSPADGAFIDLRTSLNVSGTYEGSSVGNTILIDDPYRSNIATISGNSYSSNLFAPNAFAAGANTLTVRLERADRTNVSRSITVFGYQPPVVAFTTPSSATFAAPATVTFAVDAKAPGATVTQVRFQRNGVNVGTVSSPPYQITLPSLGAGTYTIGAFADTNRGVSGGTQTTIQVLGPNVPPNISITSPASGAVFVAGANVPVTVNASDPDGGTVTLVEFLDGITVVGATNVAPFSFSWINPGLGSHTLTARATDNRSGQTTSAPVTISVVPPNTAPSVSLTNPTSGTVFTAPATISLSADATDGDGTIAKVEFFQGSTLLSTVTTAPYTFTWSNVGQGSYTLTAKATDNAGATTTSNSASITVNPPPTVVTSPADGATINASTTLVRGTFIGPVNTGITVNGVVAVTDQNNNFYAHDVPLVAGSNTLTITRTTDQGETASRTMTVTSNAALTGVEISASRVTGIAPLTVTFKVKNGGTSQGSVTFNGAPMGDVPAGATTTFNLNLATAQTFPATVNFDSLGTATTKEFVIVAKDGVLVDQMFKSVWSNVSTHLATSDVSGAMIYFAPESRDQYQAVLTNVASSLPSMFATVPVIHPTDFSATNHAEYLSIVQRNGTNYGYRLYFIKGTDGVWRLHSL